MVILMLAVVLNRARVPHVITHLDAGRKVVALTFDACETRKRTGYDSSIVRILRSSHTPATILLGGRWMETHPDETRGLGGDPLFELGNHSYLHPHMTNVSSKRMHDELMNTQGILFRATGRRATLFRPPYGEYNDAVVSCASRLGLKTLTWSLATGDPAPQQSAHAIVRAVLSRVQAGSIVIMHVNGRGWHTAEALPTIIHDLRARGYTFVRVSDALP